MSEGKGKAAILLLLLVGGGVALAASSKTANASTGPTPPLKGGVLPEPPPPAQGPAVPLGGYLLPTATGNMPPGFGTAASLSSIEAQTQFVLQWETDPVALDAWASAQNVAGGHWAAGNAQGAQAAAILAKLALVLGAEVGANPPVQNQSLSKESGYAAYSPNGLWPTYQAGLPLYLEDDNGVLPHADDGLSQGDIHNWAYLMADTVDLATLQQDMTDYAARGMPMCARAIAMKLWAQVAVRAKYGFGTGGVLVNIPAAYGLPPLPEPAQVYGGGAPQGGQGVAQQARTVQAPMPFVSARGRYTRRGAV